MTYRLFLSALVFASVAFPQAMIENALAASGGSAAGVAGKPVSEGATAIFEKMSSALGKAAGDKADTKKEAPKPANTGRYAIMPAAPPLPEVVPSAFRQIKPGTSREELLSSVGTPSSRVMIPDSEGMVEMYRYRGNGGTLGTVRLVNGKVTEVIQ